MGTNLITGYTGTRHITPAMDASVYRAAFGQDEYVMSEGNMLEGSMPTINDFTIMDGLVSMQGHMMQVSQETLTIETCATGYERIDLICLRYMHDNSTLIDSCQLVVIKGAEVQTGQTVVEPTHYTGIIDEGASVVDMPLYRINLVGSTVTFTKLFSRAYNPIEQKNVFLDFFYPVGSYYETSNTAFDPNVSWGGTWVREIEGQVHVSGSLTGTYRVNGALTNATDGGASTVKLTDAQVAHGHSFTQATYKATGGAVSEKAAFNTGGMSANSTHTHTAKNGGAFVQNGTGDWNADLAGGTYYKCGSTTASASVAHTHSVPAHTHGFTQPTISINTNGSVANLSGASSTRTAHNNMQPYIVIARWHRTA